MKSDFLFDVFLCYGSNDKKAVREIAEMLTSDGLRVWFDAWELNFGDNIKGKIEKGLEESRALVLCMSQNTVISDWSELESATFRFRDPLNPERRFIPLRLDNVPIQEAFSQFLHIDWLKKESEFQKLLEACGRPLSFDQHEKLTDSYIRFGRITHLEYELRNRISQRSNKLVLSPRFGTSTIECYAFSDDQRFALSGSSDGTIRLWDIEKGNCLETFYGHRDSVLCVAWSKDQRQAISGSRDSTIRLWHVSTGECTRIFEGHTADVWSVAWSPDESYMLSGSADNSLRWWDISNGECLNIMAGHAKPILHVMWSPNQYFALSCSIDNTIRLWDVQNNQCLRVFEGHTGAVLSAAWSPDENFILTGSADNSMRVWDMKTGECKQVFRDGQGPVWSVEWSPNQQFAFSGCDDIQMWNLENGECFCVLAGHSGAVWNIKWDVGQDILVSGCNNGTICRWDVSYVAKRPNSAVVDSQNASSLINQVQYTNAKVLLVGESGVGKTGLSKRLAMSSWEPSDSTVGAWATQWKLPIGSNNGMEREIWLWDFGGQADQRLIHQLYMDETSLAVLVFDGQKDDVFETIGQWDRDLSRASKKSFSKILVAGRIDTGGLRIGSSQLEIFIRERNYITLIETSAKTGFNCDKLKNAIVESIKWENIPWRSSPILFKQLKEEIIKLKDEGRVLLRFNELRETLQLRLIDNNEIVRFEDSELRAVVTLLAGPGIVWELKFGSWILLQPERISTYAQAVIQTMRQDEFDRGCLSEEVVLTGQLKYHDVEMRLQNDEERFVLLAMHQMLIEKGLCLREYTESGTLLVFPSYYRRERPELVGHPAVLISYRFNGFLDDIYATLVVRLHHTKSFDRDELWRYAADFRTPTGNQLGIKMKRRIEGSGELEVYFDPAIPMDQKIVFSKYVHEHLLQNSKDVIRLRHYVCPHCGTPVGNEDIAMRKLQEGKKDMACVNCDDFSKRIPLWDELEELFGSVEIKQQVIELQRLSNIILDNESKERALVGDVISTVALAGQLSREFNVSDHGIDMEIEFKFDSGQASGKKVYLQLKSGDSYLKKRKDDNVEVFTIKDERHSNYWQQQAFPVFLVIRSSGGVIRWMEISNYLKEQSVKEGRPVKQIIFEGERFDVMSVRRWKDKVVYGEM